MSTTAQGELRMAAFPPETIQPKPDSSKSVVKTGPSLDGEQPQQEPSPPRTKKDRHYPRVVIGPKHVRPQPRLFSWPLIAWSLLLILEFFIRVITLNMVQVHFSHPRLSFRDAAWQEHEQTGEEIKTLAIKRRRRVTVVNSKGGAGKTPFIFYLAAIFQWIAGNGNILIDMNQNVGTATRLAGIRRSITLTVGQAIAIMKTLNSIGDFTDETSIHRQTGLRIIASEDMDDEEDKFSKNEIVELSDRAARVFHSVYQDTGNGMSHASNLGSLETADAIVFAAVWDNDDAVVGLQETLTGYIKRGFGPKIKQNGYFVVLGTQPRWKQETIYRQFCRRVYDALAADEGWLPLGSMTDSEQETAVAQLMEFLGVTPERFFMIPFSKHIAAKKVANVLPRVIGLYASLGFRRVLKAIYASDSTADPQDIDTEFDFATEFLKFRETFEDRQPNQAAA